MGSRSPMGMGNFLGKGRPIVEYMDTLWSSVWNRQNRSRSHFGCGSDGPQGIMNCMRVQIPQCDGAIFGKWLPIVKYGDFLLWAVQKWLNRSICRLGCGLWWAEGSTSSSIFARWRQYAHMGGHIGATWRTRLNRLSVVAIQSYVKLLWPLVNFLGHVSVLLDTHTFCTTEIRADNRKQIFNKV